MSLEYSMDTYLDSEKIHCLEGERGLSALNKICNQLGYRECGWKNGTSLEEFLKDNSGCCQVIIDWIDRFAQQNDEWRDALSIESDEEIDKE